ncbi:MAG: hypothetical protein K0S47_161 [Herbinix sp.]|jgi:hypothetical protein|nr:hypothetical protein [Herbinix sp.]
MKSKIKYIALFVGVIIFFIFYFNLFFDKGMMFEDSFLKQDKINGTYEYNGTAYGEDIQVTVDGEVEQSGTSNISFYIGDFFKKYYTVNATNITDTGADIAIYEKTLLLFEGNYRKSQGTVPPIIFNRKGEPEFDIRVSVNQQSPFQASYQVSNSQIVTTAFQDNVVIRGSIPLLLMALILIIFTAIDMKSPLFFFQLRYMLSVNNPEPSEIYTFIQKITWYVNPVITLIILIAALLIH